MPKTFTSELSVSVKGAGAGLPNMNKSYKLHSKDEMELMNQSDHLAGVQTDIITLNRNQLAQDTTGAYANRKPTNASLTIETKTEGSDTTPAHDAKITWHGMDQAATWALRSASRR